MYDDFIDFVRKLYNTEDPVPLHAPRFFGNEKKYIAQAIDSTFVSSVGEFVDRFERRFADYVGSRFAIATGNGTAALHIALKLAGVGPGDEVITQPLTFVATCNAIVYCGAMPVFVDVDPQTMGISAEKLEEFLIKHAGINSDGQCVNKTSRRPIKACVPMHTFGHPTDIGQITAVCRKYNMAVIEDAAEALGSFVGSRHVGTFGKLSVFSFNGNKIITTGGGGMIATDDEALALRAKHLTTTAKLPHKWEYSHDEIGYNYRLPNLNAALGCAQLEQLPGMLKNKRVVAQKYQDFFSGYDGVDFVAEKEGNRSNYWLNVVILSNKRSQKAFLEATNEAGVITRPAWVLMTDLPMFEKCQRGNLENCSWLGNRIVNIPSSAVRENIA
jgi:perosamine synthetase